MENTIVDRFMRLIYPLSMEDKLEILSRLSENLKADFHSEEDRKSKLLDELFGAWSDTEDDLAEKILHSRAISDREISFD